MSGLSWQARRLRALAVLALAAVLLHGVVLGGLDDLRPGRQGPAPAVMTVTLRAPDGPGQAGVSVAPAPDRVEAVSTPGLSKSAVTLKKSPKQTWPRSLPHVEGPTGDAAPERASAAAVAASGANEPAALEPAALAVSSAGETEPGGAAAPPGSVREPGVAPVEAPDTPRVLAAATAARDAETSPVEPTPVYRTRFPPALTLHYDLVRGMLSGRGDLVWEPGPEGYTLKLAGSVAGLDVLAQTSQGGFDAAGLAPRRFTDQRLRRAAQAANFQRDSGRITFSGPSIEVPLRPGTQDRLSWMIQLAGIVAADPRLAGPGARVVLPVVGARGDFSVWTFAWVDAPRLATRAGDVAASHYVREPRGPQDTRVEVWLDPARQHLPVRATLRNGGDGDALELHLRSVDLH